MFISVVVMDGQGMNSYMWVEEPYHVIANELDMLT